MIFGLKQSFRHTGQFKLHRHNATMQWSPSVNLLKALSPASLHESVANETFNLSGNQLVRQDLPESLENAGRSYSTSRVNIGNQPQHRRARQRSKWASLPKAHTLGNPLRPKVTPTKSQMPNGVANSAFVNRLACSIHRATGEAISASNLNMTGSRKIHVLTSS